jgi:hypothetical protein
MDVKRVVSEFVTAFSCPPPRLHACATSFLFFLQGKKILLFHELDSGLFLIGYFHFGALRFLKFVKLCYS